MYFSCKFHRSRSWVVSLFGKERTLEQKIALIIGAGPAGLTAAHELLAATDIRPIIIEKTGDIGGLSKTVDYKGNRIDAGGHRFFSKSPKITAWWNAVLPLQGRPAIDDLVLHRELPLSKLEGAPDPEKTDLVMLVRNRVSRIYFLRSFFDYPVSLTLKTIRLLGVARIFRIALSYCRVKLFPIRNEASLEDFFINRFGRELYRTFFKDYTEKVWGVPCKEIKPEWGAQRVKGLSVRKAFLHAIRGFMGKDSSIAQQEVETSLIDKFMYPKLGPGQLWEEVARRVQERGGEIRMNSEIAGLEVSGNKVSGVVIRDRSSGATTEYRPDFLFSSMPIRELVGLLRPAPPAVVSAVADGLVYRDFMTVGVLLRKLKLRNDSKIPTINGIVPDNWIYIQERDVKIGRLQIFNNWSPYMVKDPDTVWVGVEYFCNEGDGIWNRTDHDMAAFAAQELSRIGIIDEADFLDTVVIRMPKAYPAYFGSYERFSVVREYLDKIENLFLIGRNGMHKYNNMDHSMLTAMAAVGCITGTRTKIDIWEVNAEKEELKNPF